MVLKDIGTGLKAYDNSSSRSMSLLLPMISSRVNMSLFPFIDTVSYISLANAVFPIVEKVFRFFYMIKNIVNFTYPVFNKGLGTIMSYDVCCDKVVPGIF